MSSIGPQLPPHLTKRKRTPEEDDDAPESPQSKVQRRTNDDEIALDSDDSDNDFGPSAAPTKSQGASIGPSLPPAQASNEPNSRPTTTSSQAQISRPETQTIQARGPAAPSIGPSLPQPKRILGPAPPPAGLSERPPGSPTANPGSGSDSDSDDDYGPALPTAASSRATTTNGPSIGASAPTAQPAAPQRDAWMLAPPPDRGYRVADPTQIKARKFTSGPRSGAGASSSGAGGSGSSVWFETPEEKAKRLADAVLGRAADPTVHSAPPPSAPAAGVASSSKDGSSREQDDRIRAFTEQTRGKSLYEEHQAAKAAGRHGKGEEEEEEDDPSKRAFDREKDMALGSKITHSQRREMLNRAADFGGRFQKGKYL